MPPSPLAIDVRVASDDDWPQIWAIFRDVIAAGDSFPFPEDISPKDAKTAWLTGPTATYVAVRDDTIVGSYYLKPNQPGRGAHVCNAGYMVSTRVRAAGIGRSMCAHSFEEARRLGFRAMQYNLVVATNTRAVEAWTAMGFATVGRLPGAFEHADHGFVDALIMYKSLVD